MIYRGLCSSVTSDQFCKAFIIRSNALARPRFSQMSSMTIPHSMEQQPQQLTKSAGSRYRSAPTPLPFKYTTRVVVVVVVAASGGPAPIGSPAWRPAA